MTIEQTVEVPANRRLTIDVPREIPVGRTIIAFTPATDTTNKPQPSAQREGSTLDDLNSADECPICAAHGYKPNAETIAAIKEGRAMMRGEIPSNLYNSLEEMLVDLDSDD